MKQLLTTAFIISFLFSACEALTFSDTGALSITACTPGEGITTVAQLDTASVTFSRSPNRSLAEDAFVITADGLELVGALNWHENTLSFTPFTGWKGGIDYLINVSTAAEDIHGRSLRAKFTRSFSTRSEKDRPSIISSFPADGDEIDTVKSAITIRFSEAMDPGTVADSFRLSPSANGCLTWNSGFTDFTYSLNENLNWQTEYELTIAESAADSQNNTLAESWISRFYTGTDQSAPMLQSVSNGAAFTLQPDSLGDTVFTDNPDWETNWNFVLTFSEVMDDESLQGAITFSPDLSYEETWNGNTLTLNPERELTWDTRYTLLVDTNLTDIQGNPLSAEYRYNFRANGAASKPPEVAAVVIYTDPADQTAVTIPEPYASMSLANFAPPPQDIKYGNTVVDVFFNLANGARPNLISFADNFLIREDGVNSFVPLAVHLEDDTFHPPNIAAGAFGPANPGVPYDTWVRIIVFIDNDDSAKTGLLTLTLNGEFSDDKGHTMGVDWTVPIFITD